MNADRAVVVCVVVVAAVYFYAIEQIPVRAIGDPLGPKAIPRILGVLLLISAGLLWLEIRLSGKARAAKTDTPSADQDRGHPVVVGAVVALTALYFVVFEALGYAVATTAYLAVLMAYFNRGRWVVNLSTAAGFSFCSYLLFSRLFGAQLARGILPLLMETLGHILNGFSVCLQPINLWYTFVGVLIGTIVGILPGIGPAASIALLIPMTFGMDPTSGLIMMAGIYYGTKYGGSATAILIRTPGEASSVMTSLDGYAMARNGRAGAALAVAAIGSFLAGTIGVVALTLFAVPLAAVALKFGPAEYFCLMLFALTSVAALTGKSLAKGMLATVLGLMIATVGIDLQSGQQRFTAGVAELQDGVGFIVVVVGMFALAEVFRGLEQLYRGAAPKAMRIDGKLWLTREEWRRSVGPIWRGGVIGFVVGVLPGAGGTIASLLSYSTEKRLSKHPEEFGHGAIEGVAGPEAANNADTAGAMVPLLTLGVPGGGATAVMMGAFIMHGIQPGPLLFQSRPDLVWGLIDSMYIGNVMLLVLNLPLIGIFVRLLYIPSGILYPLIIAISVIGTYAINGSLFELYMVLFFGVAGYLFDKVQIPVAPLVLSLVLAGIMEQSFRQALTLSDGKLSTFVGSGISATLVTMSALSIVLPFVLPRWRRWTTSKADPA